ncbi:MAG TPA: KH domain-containing protein [Candidatus Saccharimonadales bacterium]|nr:KH domain-containing protein [Candidatus Saccharimonadales bacterium]
MSEIDQQFIEYVVKSLVGKPDAVQIQRTIDEKGVLLELTVDPEDLGRVIGKRGATAQSLRTLLRALGTKNDARYNLKIVDNGTPPPAKSSDDTDDKPAHKKDEKADQPVGTEASEAPEPAEPAADEPEETPAAKEDETSDRLAAAREELADLDDLDI